MPKTLNLLARCIIAAGSQPAGILLFRICYWQAYAKIQHDGHTWIVKTAAEWQEETVLSSKQYEKAISVLKKGMLVEVRVFKFGRALASHVRLLERGLLAKSPPEGDLENPLEGGMENPLEGALQDHKGDTLTKIEGSDFVFASEIHAGEHGLDNPGDPGYSAPVKEDKPMPTVMEILNGGLKKKPKSLANVISPSSIADVWRDTIANEYGGFIPSFTAKQVAQLKAVEKACPPGKAAEIVAKVITDWSEYAAEVKSSAGLKVVPAQPTLNFLQAHVGAAVNFASVKEPAVKAPVVLSPKAVKKPVQSIAQAPKHQKASKAEMLSILGGKSEE